MELNTGEGVGENGNKLVLSGRDPHRRGNGRINEAEDRQAEFPKTCGRNEEEDEQSVVGMRVEDNLQGRISDIIRTQEKRIILSSKFRFFVQKRV